MTLLINKIFSIIEFHEQRLDPDPILVHNVNFDL
jgi:hypothetical protein